MGLGPSVTMGAVLGVFSLASWVSPEALVLRNLGRAGKGCQDARGGPDPLRGRQLLAGSRPRWATSQGRGAAARLALGVGGGSREAGPPLFTISTPRPREPSGPWVPPEWEAVGRR